MTQSRSCEKGVSSETLTIYDKKQDKYWGFEIKHTVHPFAEQSKHLTNGTFTNILNKKFGRCESRCVLYRGEPFDAFGIRYLNISEFLQSIDNTKNMELTMSELSECPEKNTIQRQDLSTLIEAAEARDIEKNQCVSLLPTQTNIMDIEH